MYIAFWHLLCEGVCIIMKALDGFIVGASTTKKASHKLGLELARIFVLSAQRTIQSS